ncbi:uncharacterized protein PV07_00434 [Cladophialophora immunda]|uniref:Uncharacterized protein n=1 Tax=Cladophialophora immunda TaxID=569365 RepID=A0A0D2CQX4_9EURO|nr:uncharacterized protein PV07_00434 [Cladophialophora immunda]KIW33598.1 hypothetical protein PV07_00434 [Cladophialophora immunda]
MRARWASIPYEGQFNPGTHDLRQDTTPHQPRADENSPLFCRGSRAPPSLYGIPQEELAGRGRGGREATTVFVSQNCISFCRVNVNAHAPAHRQGSVVLGDR